MLGITGATFFATAGGVALVTSVFGLTGNANLSSLTPIHTNYSLLFYTGGGLAGSTEEDSERHDAIRKTLGTQTSST